GVRLDGKTPVRMTLARVRVLALMADGLVRPKREAAEQAGVSPGVIDGLVDEGTLEAVAMAPEAVAAPPDPGHHAPDLTSAQRSAADALREAVATGGYSGTPIHGRTGAGQTGRCFEAGA